MKRDVDLRGVVTTPAGSDGGTRAPRPVRRVAVAIVAAVLAGVAFVATAVVPSSPAQAVAVASHGGKIVSANPVDNTPHVLDGYVRTFAEVGNTVLVGGNFTKVRTSFNTTQIARSYLYAFNKTTGDILPLNPTINGEVFQILPTGDGQTVWVAGGFSNVNGQTVRSIMKMNITTGQRVTSFAPPAYNGRIHDLFLRNGRLYTTGRFTTVAGGARPLFAALNPTSGALVADVTLPFSTPRGGGALNIYAADMTPDGNSLIAIGNFTKVGTADRYQIAKVDLTTGTPALANWRTLRYGNGCSQSFDSYMRDVEVSPDGSYFVVVTTGAYSGDWLCDTAARFDTNVNSQAAEPVWTQYTGGDTLTAVAISDGVVYTGGHNGWLNNPYDADRIGPGAVVTEGLAALDPRNGALLDWTPYRTLGYGVYGFLVTSSGLWIGSDTDIVGGEQHGRMALMPLNGGASRVTDFAGTLPGQAVTLKTSSTVARQFNGSTVISSTTGAGSWNNAKGAFMLNGKLYTAWSDRTFRVQTYDGTTFGPQTNISLQRITNDHPGGPGTPSNSLSRFSTQDLANLTSMFYDQATGRMYFTRSGNTNLFYRTFSQETNIVGAARQVGPANLVVGTTTVLNWSNVRGAFLAGDKLFLVDTNGKLTRWNWNPTGGPADLANNSPSSYSGTPVVGTAVDVSGPTIDGQNWTGASFVYANAAGLPNQAPVAAFTPACSNNACTFDGSASSDPDGTIASYVWNFGDGSTPGAGVNAAHAYAAAGTYNVTLTVTDDDGTADTETIPVTVALANQAPTANFTSQCTGLSCAFDGSTSADADGTIASYAWNFGDGTNGTGVNPTHPYAAAGAYTVSLTVTDNGGAPNTTTKSVTVVDPTVTPTVTFVGANGISVNSTNPTVAIPAGVTEGDTLVLLATSNSLVSATTPAGWTLLHTAQQATAGTTTFLFTKTAAANDAGKNVNLATSAGAKTALQLLAYRGADGVQSFVQAFDTVNRAERTTPVVNVTTEGSVVVSYWADKSSATNTWALPGNVALRHQAVGTVSGRVVAAVGDTGPLAPGSAGGYTATADSVNARGVVYSIVLAPDTTAANVPPSASFTTSCTNLACTVDAAASTDSDGTIVSYAWNFGDGTTGSGASTSRTYTAPGTYTITLTVTDDDGAQASTTRQVTAANPPATSVTFRGAVGTTATGGNPRVIVPAAVQAGDVMVMIVSVNATAPVVTAPAGWTPIDGVNSSTAALQTWAYTKVATATDAGTSVGPNLSATGKTSLQLVAYDNAAGISAYAFNLDTTSSNVRTTPTVAVAGNGSALISYWGDKSSSTTDINPPAGVTERSLVIGTSSGRISSLIGDTGSVAAGSAGGLTATLDTTTARGMVWSIVLAPG